jgi:hypothetical protein
MQYFTQDVEVLQAIFAIDLTIYAPFTGNCREPEARTFQISGRERSRIGGDMEYVTAGLAVVFAVLVGRNDGAPLVALAIRSLHRRSWWPPWSS